MYSQDENHYSHFNTLIYCCLEKGSDLPEATQRVRLTLGLSTNCIRFDSPLSFIIRYILISFSDSLIYAYKAKSRQSFLLIAIYDCATLFLNSFPNCTVSYWAEPSRSRFFPQRANDGLHAYSAQNVCPPGPVQNRQQYLDFRNRSERTM